MHIQDAKTMNMIWAMAADLIDGVLLNIPSNTILPTITRKYDVEIADARNLYNRLMTEINQANLSLDNKRDAMDYLKEQFYSTGPLGGIRSDLERKYAKASEGIDSLKDEVSQKQKQADQALQKAEKLENEKQTRVGTLGRGVTSLLEGEPIKW